MRVHGLPAYARRGLDALPGHLKGAIVLRGTDGRWVVLCAFARTSDMLRQREEMARFEAWPEGSVALFGREMGKNGAPWREWE